MTLQSHQEGVWHPPLLTRRQRKSHERHLRYRLQERRPGYDSLCLSAYFLWHFCRWAATHGHRCKRHVWVCPKCFDCLACLHVEGCACGHFRIEPGSRTVVVASLPGFASGA